MPTFLDLERISKNAIDDKWNSVNKPLRMMQ
jgi:hypothetical protein